MGSSPTAPIMVKTKRAKKTEVKEEPKYLYLVYDEYTEGGEICEGDEDSEWPNYEPIYHSFEPRALLHDDSNQSWVETINVDFDAKVGSRVYLVIVRYSSGSTFGTSHGHWNIPAVKETYAEAEAIMDAIE